MQGDVVDGSGRRGYLERGIATKQSQSLQGPFISHTGCLPRVLKSPFHESSFGVQSSHALYGVGKQYQDVFGIRVGDAIFLFQNLQILCDCTISPRLPHDPAVRSAPCGDVVVDGADDGVLVLAGPEQTFAAYTWSRAPHQGSILGVYGTDGAILGDGVQEGCFAGGIGLVEESGLRFRGAEQGVMEVDVICVIFEDGSGGSETCC